MHRSSSRNSGTFAWHWPLGGSSFPVEYHAAPQWKNGAIVGAVATGGQAKLRIQAGEVRVNGAIETRRGRGLKPGDEIELDGRIYRADPSLWAEADRP